MNEDALRIIGIMYFSFQTAAFLFGLFWLAGQARKRRELKNIRKLRG